MMLYMNDSPNVVKDTKPVLPSFRVFD